MSAENLRPFGIIYPNPIFRPPLTGAESAEERERRVLEDLTSDSIPNYVAGPARSFGRFTVWPRRAPEDVRRGIANCERLITPLEQDMHVYWTVAVNEKVVT